MPHPNPTTTTALLLLTLALPTTALSVAKKAAIGISVGFGTLLIVSLGAILYLKFSPARRAERKAAQQQHGQVTDADAIEFHAREQQRNFNIWDYDHNKVMASKKAARERGVGHGPVEMNAQPRASELDAQPRAGVVA